MLHGGSGKDCRSSPDACGTYQPQHDEGCGKEFKEDALLCESKG